MGFYTEVPFQMGDDYLKFRVTKPMVEQSVENLHDKSKKVLNDQNILVIVENIDSMGLMVYDPQGTFKSCPLQQGDYIEGKDYVENSPVILAKENSIVHINSKDNNKKYYRNGKEFKVRGIYDSDHPLYTPNTEFIYNLFLGNDLRGTYYVDGNDKETINNMMTLLEEHGYTVNLLDTGASESFFG